jgi:hypothetical protein
MSDNIVAGERDTAGLIDVVEYVAAKALRNISEPHLSRAWPQHIQSKTIKLTRFQHISIIAKNWFGTRYPT